MNEAERSMLERAIEVAVVSHAGQVDKNGERYILHPLRVMFAVRERGSSTPWPGPRSAISLASSVQSLTESSGILHRFYLAGVCDTPLAPRDPDEVPYVPPGPASLSAAAAKE